MPSEKAKDNKALVATCAACQKSLDRSDGFAERTRQRSPQAIHGMRPVRERRMASAGVQRNLPVSPRIETPETSAVQPFRLGGEFGAEVGMRHRDQLARAFAYRFALQRRDAVLGHHVMNEGARQCENTRRRDTRHDT